MLPLPAAKPHRFGVALGGGTARAFAHVGVLRVLDEVGTPPEVLAGTSFGALIAAHYALHKDAEKLWRWAETFPAGEVWRQGVDFGLHRAALVEGGKIEGWLERTLFHGATFADLKTPLHVTCTDVNTGELVVLREGSLARAVRASCALPLVTRAVAVGPHTLIDGGFVSPVPVTPLWAEADLVMGVHAGITVEKARSIQLFRRFHASRVGAWWHRRFLAAPAGAYGTLLRGLARAGASYNRDLTFAPETLLLRIDPGVAWWDLHRSLAAAGAGERAMRATLPELTARLGAPAAAASESVL